MTCPGPPIQERDCVRPSARRIKTDSHLFAIKINWWYNTWCTSRLPLSLKSLPQMPQTCRWSSWTPWNEMKYQTLFMGGVACHNRLLIVITFKCSVNSSPDVKTRLGHSLHLNSFLWPNPPTARPPFNWSLSLRFDPGPNSLELRWGECIKTCRDVSIIVNAPARPKIPLSCRICFFGFLFLVGTSSAHSVFRPSLTPTLARKICY